jgi:carboxypeptidase Taq
MKNTNQLWMDFERHFSKIRSLGEAISILSWDRETTMPEGSARGRAAQLSYLETHLHELSVDSKFVDTLETLSTRSSDLTATQNAAIRHQRRKVGLLTRVPASLVSAKSEATSRAYESWRQARVENDFKRFAPDLSAVLEIAQQEGDCLKKNGQSVYEALMGKYDPGVSLEFVRKIFSDLARELVPFSNEIVDRHGKIEKDPIDWSMSEADQQRLNRSVLQKIGFDFKRGRLDRSVHPFCGGGGADIRLTTRYDENDWNSSLFGAIHEGGHGMYELGMEEFSLHPALRESPGMAFHESQSRFWENIVGRSRAFSVWLESHLKSLNLLAPGVNALSLERRLNEVSRSFIRTESDEVTYNLHVILRFEIETGLFDGTIAVKDLPEVWREKMRTHVGIVPNSDTDGVLQDIHWSMGAFGYFPSYALGNLISAQLFGKLKRELSFEKEVAEGNFQPLLSWLQKNAHARGCELTLMELVREVTGEQLTPVAFMQYLKEKYE